MKITPIRNQPHAPSRPPGGKVTIQDPQLSCVERGNLGARCAASRVWAGWPLWGLWVRSNPPIVRPHAGRRICFGENHPYKKSASCAEPAARRKSDNPGSAVIMCREGKSGGTMRRESSLGGFTGHQICPFTRHLQGSRIGLFVGARLCAA